MSHPANPYEPTTSTVGELFAAQGNYDGLAGTATGLKIIYFSILLMLLCIIGMIVAAFALPLAIVPLSFLNSDRLSDADRGTFLLSVCAGVHGGKGTDHWLHLVSSGGTTHHRCTDGWHCNSGSSHFRQAWLQRSVRYFSFCL